MDYDKNKMVGMCKIWDGWSWTKIRFWHKKKDGYTNKMYGVWQNKMVGMRQKDGWNITIIWLAFDKKMMVGIW